VVGGIARVSRHRAVQDAVMKNMTRKREGAGSMSQSLMKRGIALTVIVGMMLPELPSALGAVPPIAPPRFPIQELALGDTQAIGPHYARQWEKLSDLARQAQGQGALVKSGTPQAFLREPVDIARLTADVLQAGKDLHTMGSDMEQQFAHDEQFLREKSMPAVFFERLNATRMDFLRRRDEVEAGLQQLGQAQRIANYDAEKGALQSLAKSIAAMPSAKSFIPMKKEALAREGRIAPVRAPMTTAADLRTAIEGPQTQQKSLVKSAPVAKAAPAAPTAADLAATDDAQITTKIQAQATALGNNPVAIYNWVRNNIDYIPTYGSIQGSEVTRINKRGNAMDTASLLVAMLRAANIPARYVIGTVQLPIAQAQNWLGGNIAPNQVVELMQKGGIPSQSVISGGQVSAVQFEHAWVEAYVDFTPSRGAVNRTANTWVPMDASFKVYDVHPPINLTQGVSFDAQGVMNQVNATAIHGQFGSVTGLDWNALDTAYASFRTSAINYANQVTPGGARLLDVRGYAAIVPVNLPILPGAAPYTVLAKAATYSTLPATLEHVVKISYYATETDYSEDSPAFTYSLPLAKVGISTFGVDYVPATQADKSLFAQLRQSNAPTLSPYLINVIPQLQIEGQPVQSGGAVQMGTVQYWKADITDPQGIYPPTSAGNRVLAGSHMAYVVDAAGITPDMVQTRLDLIPEGVAYPLREGMQQAGMHFWMMRDSMDQNWASQFGGKVVRLPSVGAFSAPLQATFSFGVARSGFFNGYQTDIKRNLYSAVNDTQAHQLQMFTLIGNTGSMLEGEVWEMLLGVPLGTAASAARVLAAANEQKIPVYIVDSTNVSSVLPILQISADAQEEISNAVAAGNRVVVPEREVTIGKWTGAGYVIQDPVIGTGVYQIDGGFSGSQLIGCLLKALLENCSFQKLLAKRLQSFIDSLIDQALTKAALLAPAGTAFPVAVAMSAQFMWFMAFQFAVYDFAEMAATGELEEDLAAILACSIPSRCGIGRGSGTGFNPVYIGTGEKLEFETDYVGAGDDPLELRRTYWSIARNLGDSNIGQKWRHSYERSVFIPPPTFGVDDSGAPIGDGYSITEDTGVQVQAQVPAVPPAPDAVLMVRGDGSYLQFNNRSGAYVPDSDVPEALSRQSDASGMTTGWVYFNDKDETEQYDGNGVLQSITNRQGMTQTLTYNASGQLATVRDHFGRTLTFTYNADGNVDTITDPANGVFRYGYDPSGNLTSVQTPDQKTRQYFYEQDAKQGWLTGIQDENGNRYATYKYDFQGRVIEEFHAGNVDHTTFDYAGDLVTNVTDGLGTTRTYQFTKLFDDKALVQVTQPCASCGGNGDVAQIAYDANGFISSKTDFNGNQTLYSNNARGLETSRTEAFGSPIARTIATEYDPQWRVPTKITEPTSVGNRVTTFTLDPRGNVLTKTVAAGGESRTWTYTYNSVGQMLTMDGPRTDVADVTTYTYVNGNLDTETDAVGNVTQYGNYDAHGRPGTNTDANGLVTTMTYDARGRLKTSSSGGETTAYDYDGVGNLSKLTLPDGTSLSYGYDAAERLTSVSDSLGNSVTYTLDGLGNRKREDTRDPVGLLAQTMTRTFDALSRVQTMVGAANQTTTYTYDDDGNLKSATDPLTHVTGSDYDALNRLIRITDPQLAGAPAAGTIGYGYDTQDNLASVTDQRGLVTHYGYSGFDELKTLTSPDTGITQYTYDPAGNVKAMQDSRGQSATYSYDALNRLKTLVYSDESLSFTYDDTTSAPNSKGRLSTVTDGSGSTTYAYDVQGRVTGRTQVVGSVSHHVGYAYNAAGQLATLTTPSGQSVSYGYANNQVTSIAVNGTAVLANAKYFPLGEVASWAWGNGQGYQRVYDTDGRIQSVTIAGTVRTYGFDDASRITGLTDTVGSASAPTTVGYDNLDRLTSAHGNVPGGFEIDYAYDLIGNRTSRTLTLVSSTTGGPQIRAYSYDAASNRLTAITNPGTSYSYDGAGNTTGDGTYTYAYSGRSRLVAVEQGTSTVATYKLNAFGERVAKTVGGATRLFVYDEDRHLLGEYDGTGALIQETVWLEDTPVATLRPKSGGGVDIDYVWADHLDSPRAVTTSDAAAVLLWSWNSDPFGATAASGSIEYNLRFQGQYFDEETSTHYNYFRDYNPTAGRYAQSDPIGLDGGINTYGYVEADPIQYTDPLGLKLPKPGHGKGSVPPAQRDKKRLWSQAENDAKLQLQCGKCAHCDVTISKGVGHHVKRHADGGRTNDANHAVVCEPCHHELHSK
jgi:RHS repeat-associated protein